MKGTLLYKLRKLNRRRYSLGNLGIDCDNWKMDHTSKYSSFITIIGLCGCCGIWNDSLTFSKSKKRAKYDHARVWCIALYELSNGERVALRDIAKEGTCFRQSLDIGQQDIGLRM